MPRVALTRSCGEKWMRCSSTTARPSTCSKERRKASALCYLAGNVSLPSSGPISPESRRPERIGRYTIHGVLGEGGMGTVYEARQENPSRSVALKVIRPEALGPSVLRRFQFEAQLLGQLQAPGNRPNLRGGYCPRGHWEVLR